MAITTNRAHVVRALDFFNKSETYFAIGKRTAWSEEDGSGASDTNPPAPDTMTTEIKETIGFKKVENIFMVVPDNDEGTISYRDSRWKVVPADQALAQNAKWVYIDTTIRYDELPLGFYRQIGVFTDLKKKKGEKEVVTLTVNSKATEAGNVAVTLDGQVTSVSIKKDATAIEVATAIRGTVFNGYVTGGESSTNIVTFTADTVGKKGEASFSSANTGITADMSVTTNGQDATPAEKTNLLPEEVADIGRLEVIDNRQPANRQSDQKEKLSLVIEF